MARHEEFLQLCAVSISGELTEVERKKLHEHLKVCASCREALSQFKASVKATIPVAAEQAPEAGSDASFSVEQAEAAFFARFDREGGFSGPEPRTDGTSSAWNSTNGEPHDPIGAGWGQLWVPFAAVLILSVALGIASYRMGIKRGIDAAGTPNQDAVIVKSLKEQLNGTAHERDRLLAQLATQDQTIAQLRKQIDTQPALSQPEELVPSNGQSKQGSQITDGSTEKLEALQKQLEAEEQVRAQLAARANQLEGKLADLSKQLQENETTSVQQKRQLEEREAALAQERELLEHDHDIRDLMGARKLYVVDVYDVAGNGTSKPYGRVFYTQGKSLIFYAYDLDQEPGLRKASTFQAWGRRGPNKDHALNLGVFYEDNAANKRWVVKFDDPKSLAQIDAVFVTVEPDAHSNTPRGKQVLFAYLKVDPNHP